VTEAGKDDQINDGNFSGISRAMINSQIQEGDAVDSDICSILLDIIHFIFNKT
jgi:hypothetical protein